MFTAALFGAAAAFAAYFPVQMADLSPRVRVAIVLAVFLVFAGLAYWGIFYYARRRLAHSALSAKAQAALLIGMILAGVFLALAYPVMPIARGKQYLQITALGERNPLSSGNEVRIEGFYGWHGERIPFSEFRRIGKKDGWARETAQFVANREFPAKARWESTWLHPIRLLILTLPSAGKVELVWNDRTQVIDLYAPKPATKIVVFQPKFQFAYQALYVLAYGLAAGLLLCLALVTLVQPARRPASGSGRRAGRWSILAYAAPMIAVWLVYWLAFWPGMLSPDPIAQLAQIANGVYNDWHPIFHTWTMRLILQVWDSPAAITLFQILALALTAGAAYYQMARLGTPLFWRIVSVALFSLSLANSLLVVTVWKDVLFTVALLALFIYWVDLVATRGQGKRSVLYWAGFLLTALLVSLYRHNGASVILLSIPVLILFFKAVRKPAVVVLLIYLPVLWFLKGPFLTIAKVEPQSGTLLSFFQTLNVASHIAAGEEFSPADREYLNSILPYPEGWDHSCYIPYFLIFKNEYNAQPIAQRPEALQRIFLNTLLHNPRVNLDYLVCSSSIIWRISNTPVFYVTAMSESNTHLQSKLRKPARIITRRYYWSLEPENVTLLWRPAVYLYVFLLGVLIKAVNGGRRYLLLAVPVLGLILPLAFFVSAQDFRYVYFVYAVAVLYAPYLYFSRAGSEQPAGITASPQSASDEFAAH